MLEPNMCWCCCPLCWYVAAIGAVVLLLPIVGCAAVRERRALVDRQSQSASRSRAGSSPSSVGGTAEELSPKVDTHDQ